MIVQDLRVEGTRPISDDGQTADVVAKASRKRGAILDGYSRDLSAIAREICACTDVDKGPGRDPLQESKYTENPPFLVSHLLCRESAGEGDERREEGAQRSPWMHITRGRFQASNATRT